MTNLPRFVAIVVLLALAGMAPGVEGDWFIHTGANGVWSSNAKHPAAKKLVKRAAKSVPICLAFTAQDDWTLLDGINHILASDAPPSLSAKVLELGKAGHAFRWLAFTPQGGWALLYDKNSYVADGLPRNARAGLEAAAQAGTALRSIAFGPQGSWVIVGDKEIVADGVPDALDNVLRDHVRKRIAVRCVAFTSQGDWFVLNGRNECLASDTKHPAYKKLEQLRAAGEVLQWIAFAPGDYAGGAILERTPGKRITAVLECSVDAPDGGVAEWIVCVPRAPSLDRQIDVENTLTPAGKPVQELSPLKRGLLVARLKDRPRGFQAKLTIEATLMTTRLRPRVAGDAPVKAELDPDLAKLYTRASETVDFKGQAFQDWLEQAKLRRGPDENDMSFARRVFRHLKYNLRYERRDDMDFRASTACRTGKTDCGGMSNLFVAAMRAGGVPARVVAGRHARSETPAEKGSSLGTQMHVRAEFFAHDVGWVPVEVNNAVVDDRRGEFAHFGNDAGDFLVMHVDTDLIVESYVGGRSTQPLLQACCWWRRGGTGKGYQVREHWTVR